MTDASGAVSRVGSRNAGQRLRCTNNRRDCALLSIVITTSKATEALASVTSTSMMWLPKLIRCAAAGPGRGSRRQAVAAQPLRAVAFRRNDHEPLLQSADGARISYWKRWWKRKRARLTCDHSIP